MVAKQRFTQIAALTLVLTGACATGSKGLPNPDRLEPYQCGTVQRLHVYRDIFLGSQPAPEDLEHAKKGGIATIVNFRHPEEQKFDEAALVQKLGMHYVSIPWNGPDELTDQVFDKAIDAIRNAEKPVFVHCHSGNRVGAIWLAYRAVVDRIPLDEAEREARIVGLKSPAYARKAREYAKRHGAN